MNDTIDSFNYTSDSFLDAETRSALNDFTAASVDSINITGILMTMIYSLYSLIPTSHTLLSLSFSS